MFVHSLQIILKFKFFLSAHFKADESHFSSSRSCLQYVWSEHWCWLWPTPLMWTDQSYSAISLLTCHSFPAFILHYILLKHLPHQLFSRLSAWLKRLAPLMWALKLAEGLSHTSLWSEVRVPRVLQSPAWLWTCCTLPRESWRRTTWPSTMWSSSFTTESLWPYSSGAVSSGWPSSTLETPSTAR